MSFFRRVFLLLCAAVLLAGCSVPWKKEQAGIQVQMTDGGTAQVYLDTLHLGQTPIQTQDLKPGTYQLRIEPEKAGKTAYEGQIHLYPGSLTSVLWSFSGQEIVGTGDVLELEPLPSKERAELSVTTVPEGASVSLNSTTYGLSPVILDEVQPGQYSLTIHAVGHIKKTMSVQIQSGFRLHMYSRLEKEGSGEELSSPTPSPSPASEMPSPSPSSQTNTTTVPSPSPTPRGVSTASPQPSALPEKPYVTIKDTGTGWLRVRSEASSAAEEVARVNVGESFTYKSTLNGWFEIEYTSGQTGWISGQYGNLTR